MNKNLSNKYLKIGQTAKALGVSPDTLRRWEKEGKITPQKTQGGTRLYPGFLKIGAAAKTLGVSIDTLRRWEKKGKIKSIRTAGGTRLYPPDILTEEKEAISSTEDLLKKLDAGKLSIFKEDALEIGVKTPKIQAPEKIYARIYARIYAYIPLLITTLIIAALAGAVIFASFWREPQKLSFKAPSGKSVLGALTNQSFLEINSDTQINGALAIRDTINNLQLEATPSASTFELISGDTTLTITDSGTIDQDLSSSSSPTFTAVNLSGTANQISSGANQFTLPAATTTLVGTNTTQTLTNKSLSGASNTFTSIPNSGLSNSKVTVTAGTNLSGGGDVSLGSSITLSLASSPSISGVIQLADGTAAAPSLTFTNDTDTGLYRIGSNSIGLITGGSATSGITINSSGNLGVGTISPTTALYVVGAGTVTSNLTVDGNVGIGTSVTPAAKLGVVGNVGIGSSFAFANVPVNGLAVQGNVGIGTTTPDYPLHVIGNVGIGSSLTVSSAAALNTLNVSGISSLTGNVGVGTSLNVASNIYGLAGIRIAGFADLAGNVGIGGSLTVSSLSTFLSSILGTDGSATAPGYAFNLDTDTGLFRPGTNALGLATGGSSRLTVTAAGLIGIGITSPAATFQVNSGSSSTVITSTGNVGVGTTSPLGALHVVGQCVVGNTKLRKRRKNKKGEWVWDEVEIKDIKPGDEILTLDEKTGEFIPSKVKGLMDMGIQQVYMLVTQHGKMIETTDNHPYLIKQEDIKIDHKPVRSTVFEVDQSIRTEDKSADTILGIANLESSFISKLDKKQKQIIYQEYAKQSKPKMFGPEIFAKMIVATINKFELKVTRLIIDREYSLDYDKLIVETIESFYPDIVISFRSIGKSSPAHLAAFLTHTRRNIESKKEEVVAGSKLKGFPAAELLHFEFTKIRSPHYLLLSPEYSTEWVKVKYLKSGMVIATTDGWEKISNIYPAGKKQTYDIEVENTHNFVGNDIVAHNTYLQGNLGVGTFNGLTTPTNGLAVSGNVGIGTTTANSALSVAGNAHIGSLRQGIVAPTDGLFVDGNVGIGATTSNNALDVWGNARITGTLRVDSTGTLGNGLIGYLGVTAPASGLAVSGNVGVGTTSPLGALHVIGQCVAKGTRIRRKRKGSRGKGEEDWEDVPVEDIKPDDEVLSLNNKTGEWEWNKVEKTMDMGIQGVFRLETESGKWVETTANHPYLVLTANKKAPVSESSFVGLHQERVHGTLSINNSIAYQNTKWIKVSQLKIGQYIATENGWEKIVSIQEVGRKQTYDLQIANTHNFLANDIVAHNTYINGNLGIGAYSGLTVPTNGLAVSGNVGIGITTANSALTVNGGVAIGSGFNVTAPTDGLLVQGNVGIGWTSPSQLFQVNASYLGVGLTVATPFVVTSQGNVGIGTSSPRSMVDILAGSLLQTPTNPTYVGGANRGSSTAWVFHVVVQGRYAYLTAIGATGACSTSDQTACDLQIFDITVPSSPTYVGGVASPGSWFGGIAIAGRYVYVQEDAVGGTCSSSDGTGCEIRVYDISNPTSPTYVGGVDNGGTSSINVARQIFISGHYLYTSIDPNGGTCNSSTNTGCEFQIYDISNPTSPTYVGGADNGGNGGGEVYVQGRYAYMTASANVGTCNSSTNTGCELQVYDISNPSNPTYVGGADISSASVSAVTPIFVSGRYAYVGHNANATACTPSDNTGCELSIFDISNPASPTYVGGADNGGNSMWGLFVSGRYAYLAVNANAGTCNSTTNTGCEVQMYDVSNPASPIFVGGVDNGSTNNSSSVFVSGRYAYVTKLNNTSTCSSTSPAGCELQVYDISGIEATSVLAHSFEAGSLQVRENGVINNNLTVGGGLNIGNGGIFSAGSVGIGVTSALSAFYVQQLGTGPAAAFIGGNVGIGTSTTSSTLQIVGNSVIGFAPSAAGPSLGLAVSGNVGFGTTSPLGALHVVGQCVTGDTKLRRRKRNKKGKFTDEYEEVEIKDIKEDDEILTFNESTGKFEPHQVRGLMDMGLQEVFELTTESGKSIQTTKSHPYFVDLTNTEIDLNMIQKETFEYSEKLGKEFYINHLAGRKIKSKALGDIIGFTHTGWNHFVEKSRSLNELITRFFALPRVPIVIKKADKIGYRKLKKTDMTVEYWELQAVVENVLISVIVCAIDGGSKFFLTCNWLGTKTERGIKAIKKELSLTPNVSQSERSDRRRELVIPQLFNKLTLPENRTNVKWVKVQDLVVGQKIATIDGWEQIVSIKSQGRKQTFDIEVEDTHNFVGNDIVAHNTYINGNLGIGAYSGLTVPTNGLAVSGNMGIGITTANSALTVNGGVAIGSGFNVTAPTNGLLVQGNVGIGTTIVNGSLIIGSGGPSGTGNVGIGLTGFAYPSFKLQVAGNIGPDQGPTISATTQTATTIDTTGTVGPFNSAVIGPDGFPIISASRTGVSLRVTKCGNASCSSGNTSTSIGTGNIQSSSPFQIAIGADGLPVIAYMVDAANDGVHIVKCGNLSCSSGNTDTTVATAAASGMYDFSMAIGTDGFPVVVFRNPSTAQDNFVKCSTASCSSSTIATNVTGNTANRGAFSMAIGTDGFPIFSFRDGTNARLLVTKCGNAACSSGNTTTTVDSANFNGSYSSIAIGADGLAVISYKNTQAGNDLMLAKCGNAACSSGNILTTVESANDIGDYSSVAIGTDGLPFISYYDATVGNLDLRVAKCSNATCSTSTITSIDTTDTVGQYTSAVIGTDGLPFISFYDATNADLRVIKCATVSCSATTGTALTGGSSLGNWMPNSRSYGSAFETVNTYQIANPSTFQRFSILSGGAERLSISPQGNVGIGTSAANGLLDVQKALFGAPSLTGKYLSISASTFTDQVTASSGTATNMVFNSIAQPTLAAANSPVTTTNAYAFYLAGAPVAGTNELVNNSIALGIAAGAVGTGTTASYGLYVNAQTGAASNYAAVFATGNVGIGFTSPGSKLDVFNTTSSSDIDIFRVLSNVTNTGNVKFRVDSDGDVFSDGGTAMGTPADVAENYPVLDENIEAGDLVTTSNQISEIKNTYGELQPYTEKSSFPYQNNLIGIISTKPGVLLSANTEGRSVALAGRVPVKVSTENGPIEVGDFLTSSSIPGVAMKATRPGQVIGKALEGYSGEGGTACPVQQKTTLSDGSLTDRTSDEVAPDLSGNTLSQNNSNVNSQNVEVTGIEPAQPGLIGQMPHQSTPTQTPLCGKALAFVNVSFADPNNFFASLSLDNEGNLIIPKIRTANIILDSSVASASAKLTIDNGQLTIKEDSNYNSTGPQLASNNNSYDLAGKIGSLEDRIAALEAASSKYYVSSIKGEEATPSADLASHNTNYIIHNTDLNLTPPDILLATGSATLANLKVTSEATVSGKLLAYDLNISNSFKSLGETTLGKTLVAGDLIVDGMLSITGSSLSNLSILYIQNSPLAQGLDIFNGKVTIDKEGNITTQGKVTASEVETNKLTILAASIGTTTLPANTIKITIPSTLITPSSKIFITPTTATDKVLSVTNVKDGESFDVESSGASADEIKFNWWIVQTN